MKKEEEGERNHWKFFLIGVLILALSVNLVFAADPVYPDQLDYGENSTKGVSSSLFANVSGGYISNFNLTASVQNPRWKAFVGEVIGTFTLDDAAGSTIYDWTFTTGTGRVYATRKASAVTWSSIACATVENMETENTAMVLNSEDDNITSTFDDSSHDAFPVGSTNIGSNSCPTLNTFVNSARNEGAGQPYEEMVLYDGSNLVFATIMEDGGTGYNGETYDFQMIVPENGTAGYTGATPYYLYIELGN
jgi:hypothetical protein